MFPCSAQHLFKNDEESEDEFLLQTVHASTNVLSAMVHSLQCVSYLPTSKYDPIYCSVLFVCY